MAFSSRFKKAVRPAVIGVLAIFALAFSYFRLFDLYELQTYDLRCQLRGQRPAAPDIVFVDIADDTLEALGAWPFDREYHAHLIEALRAAGARAVAFDVLFVEPHPNDGAVVEAARSAGNVYFACGFSDPRKGRDGVLEATEVEDVLPAYREVSRGVGFVNTQVDRDGKRRRTIPLIRYAGEPSYQMSFLVAMDLLGVPRPEIELKPGKYLRIGARKVPLDEDNCMLVNYVGKWGQDFKHYSYFHVLAAYAQKAAGEKPILDLSELKGKVCIIGLTSTGTHDANPIPIQTVYPQVGTYANILSNILLGDHLWRLDRVWNLLIVAFFGLWVGMVSARFSPFGALWRTLATVALYVAAVFFIFLHFGIWIDVFYPVAVMLVIYAAATLSRVIDEMRKREVIEGELKTASQIQRSFLPENLPHMPGIEMAVYMKPAKAVGGDLYTFMPIGERKMGVMLGDVSGKGTPAALFMAKTVSEFKFSARDQVNPAQAVVSLNDSISSESTGGLFVTLSYAIFDLASKTMRLANAGHLPLVSVTADGVVAEQNAEGMPVGVMAGVEFPETARPIATGDVFAFYSDGVTEARNKKAQEFGFETLKNLLIAERTRTPQEILDRAVEELWKFIGKADQHDDITLIVVKIGVL